MLVDAAALVVREFPRAHFLIVGEGPQKPMLEEKAKSLGVQANVHFLGARSDITGVVAHFDIAVLSSHPVVETLSNAVLEYMAAGKPVVTTRVGSLPEQVEEGHTGFLVEPGDSKTMAERLLTLLKDPERASKMGQAGKHKAESEFTIEKMLSMWGDLFVKLAKENS